MPTALVPALLGLDVQHDLDVVLQEFFVFLHPDRRRPQQEDVIAALVRREVELVRRDRLALAGRDGGLFERLRQVGRLAVRREDGHRFRRRGVEQLMLVGMAPLVDEDDFLALLRGGVLRQEHVEVGRRRRGDDRQRRQGQADRFSHHRLPSAGRITAPAPSFCHHTILRKDHTSGGNGSGRRPRPPCLVVRLAEVVDVAASKAGMDAEAIMIQPPKAIGLFLCDQVIFDRDTQKPCLIGCFAGLAVNEFPSGPQRFDVFSVLTDGLGDVTIDLTATHLDTEDEVYMRAPNGTVS